MKGILSVGSPHNPVSFLNVVSSLA